MPRIHKRKKKAYTNREKVRIFRKTQAILKECRMNGHIEYSQVNNVDQSLERLAFSGYNEKKKCVSRQLESWALGCNIKRNSVTKLLKILKVNGMPFLPKDSRTLLHTPRSVTIEHRADGKYWHNGLRNCLVPIFSQLNKSLTIDLTINTDGLPLFRSSSVEFWPILGNIYGK